MGRPGRKRRLALEDEFFTLVGNGMSVSGAARQLEISRSTALNWRRRYGGVQRERVPEAARSSRYLSLIERERLAVLRRDGHGVREIARRLRRSASTISRELRRNMLPGDRGVYDAGLAHARSRQNAKRTRSSVFARDCELRHLVQRKLELQWSPEQIAAWLRREHPGRTSWDVYHETIYQGLYFGGPHGLARALARHLRTGRGQRFPRRPAKGRRPRFTVAAKLIDERPIVVEHRSPIGDFEGNLIIGRRGESAIATLVDRKTRLVKLVRVGGDRRSESVAAAIRAEMMSLPAHARRTLTWDQGPETDRHDLLANVFTDGVFFAYPGAPWQRGSNENTNGLLRQYLSRKTDLTTITTAELTRVENRLNSRPRKTLGWHTPAALFTAAMAH